MHAPERQHASTGGVVPPRAPALTPDAGSDWQGGARNDRVAVAASQAGGTCQTENGSSIEESEQTAGLLVERDGQILGGLLNNRFLVGLQALIPEFLEKPDERVLHVAALAA